MEVFVEATLHADVPDNAPKPERYWHIEIRIKMAGAECDIAYAVDEPYIVSYDEWMAFLEGGADKEAVRHLRFGPFGMLSVERGTMFTITSGGSFGGAEGTSASVSFPWGKIRAALRDAIIDAALSGWKFVE